MTEGLKAFHGAGRRFEKKGEYHGAMVYDDYAHHPHELQALLTTARGLGYSRVICAFQPTPIPAPTSSLTTLSRC